MMDDHLPDQLDRLPTELKCVVASYITELSDRKALVLVNKAWSDVVLPHLWETFTTDLTQTNGRHVMGLASPKSNIIKHLRIISLLTRALIPNVDHLPTLLAVIPRGQLRGFKSVSQLQLSTVNLLLRLHPKLQQCDLPSDNTFANALLSGRVTGCLPGLTFVTVNLKHFPTNALQMLWVECPKLAHLKLKGNKDLAVMHEDAFLPADKSFRALKVSFLGLGNITIPQRLDTMFQWIDALALRHSVLHAFAGTSGFLKALSEEYSKGHSRLARLRISALTAQTPAGISMSLGMFLSSFRGLQSLLLQFNTSEKLYVDSIVHHGETPRTLCIVNGTIHRQDATASFDASDLLKVATDCPQLRQLCLNLYEIDPDHNESDVLGPQADRLYTPNEFKQALSAIASMPKLQVLRFTNPHNYRKAYHRPGDIVQYFQRNLQSGIERQGFQARADGIMRYSGEYGSNVKVLAFSPIEKLNKADNPDKNGHVWPDYYYSQGRTTDHKGRATAVAVPLTNWKDDYASATILEELT